jgi:photosystem II stability/assembly factor-like uncharacterized protein
MPSCKPFLMTVVLLAIAAASPTVDAEILYQPRLADQVPLAHKSLILDVVRAGERYIAIGERGHVVISRDGREWEQAEEVPVSTTLTRIAFSGGRLWAVGHDTTIISSRDMGQTWRLQFHDPGRNEPLLDVHFFDSSTGLAIGAYGLLMTTDDGGDNWEVVDMTDVLVAESIDWDDAAEQVDDHADDFDDDEFGDDDLDWNDDLYDDGAHFDRGCYEFMECHHNALVATNDGRVMIAAERGYGFRSEDRGRTWESFRFPYPGSMFGLLEVYDGILAFGLRGNVQFSADFGDEWEVLDTGVEQGLMGATTAPDGRAVIVGSGGTILYFDPDARRFSVSEDILGGDYATALFTTDGLMILAGEEGLRHE